MRHNRTQFFMVLARGNQHAMQIYLFFMSLTRYQHQVRWNVKCVLTKLFKFKVSIFSIVWILRSTSSTCCIVHNQWKWAWSILCGGPSNKRHSIYNELCQWTRYSHWTERKLHSATNFIQYNWSVQVYILPIRHSIYYYACYLLHKLINCDK